MVVLKVVVNFTMLALIAPTIIRPIMAEALVMQESKPDCVASAAALRAQSIAHDPAVVAHKVAWDVVNQREQRPQWIPL